MVPQVKLRFLGFIIVVLCGTVLLSWITHTLWTQLDRLQKDYAAVKSESFYSGVHLRGALRALNEKLLQYGISQDPVAGAKVMSEFAREHELFVIKAGAMPNSMMSAKDVKALALLPSREELLAKLMGTMQAPVAKLVRTMNEVPGKFVRTLAAYRDSKEKAAA